MEYILIICISLITLAVLKFVWGIRIKDIKLLKELGFDKKLNEITNKLPENREICNDILKILGNENVNVKENEGNQASLYIAISNSIIIANIKNTFTRVQTIAHECLHSVQNRRTLIFNFILSNLKSPKSYLSSLLSGSMKISRPGRIFKICSSDNVRN